MTEEELTLTLTGSSRQDVINQAKDYAATWFDVPSACIAVTIQSAEVVNVTDWAGNAVRSTFQADLTTRVSHILSTPPRGPARCSAPGCDFAEWGRS